MSKIRTLHISIANITSKRNLSAMKRPFPKIKKIVCGVEATRQRRAHIIKISPRNGKLNANEMIRRIRIQIFCSCFCVSTKFISHWKRFISEAQYFSSSLFFNCLHLANAIKFGCEASAMTTQIEEMWTLNAQPKWQYVFTTSVFSLFLLLSLLLLSFGSEFGFRFRLVECIHVHLQSACDCDTDSPKRKNASRS